MGGTYNIYRRYSGQRIVWGNRVNGIEHATERAFDLRTDVGEGPKAITEFRTRHPELIADLLNEQT